MTTRVERVELEWIGKIADLKAKIESVPGISKKAARQMSNALVTEMKAAQRDAGKEVDTLVGKLDKEANKLAKIGGIIGGPLGNAVNNLGDVSELAAGGMGKVVLAGVAIGAAVGGIAAFGAAVYDVLANLDQYRDRIDSLEGRDILDAQAVENLKVGSAALAEAKGQLSDIAVVTASEVAPAVEGFVIGSVYAFNLLRGVVSEAYGDMVTAGQAVAESLSNPLSLAAAARAAAAIKALGDVTDDFAEADTAATTAARQAYEAIHRQADAIDLRTDAEREAAVEAERAAERRAQAWDRQFASAVESDRKVLDLFAELDADIATQRQAMADAQVQSLLDEADAAVNASRIRMEAKRAETDAVLEENQRQAAAEEQLAKKRMADAQSYLGGVQAVFGAAASIVEFAYDRQASAAEDGSDRQRQVLRRMWVAQKAIALSQATISTAQAVLQALASSPPPANFVLAALAGAAGGAQIGIIAAQKQPSMMHTGGMVRSGYAPDEVDIRAQSGEGVVSRRGMDALAQINRGTAAAAPPTVVNVIGNRVIDAMAASAVNNRSSAISRAARNARGVAGHRSLAYA